MMRPDEMSHAELDQLTAETDRRQAPEFTEESLALKFAGRHADDLRYVAAWGKWLRWTGQQWQLDNTLHVFSMAREICRETAVACNDKKTATRLAAAQTVGAVERLAKADRRLAATVGQWDSDPWLLNTPGGIIELWCGGRGDHGPEFYLTKMTAVAPGGECPTWLAFLDRVTGGNTDLQGFLQRMAGYALSGDISAHALFFMFGTGANGKSVFLDTLAGIMGDYHKTAPIETFTASHGDRHPTELAGLMGARLVTSVETEEGRRWAESRIKALTGGDEISARFMRQDFFEFVPQFKLVIAGNHKPGLRSVDEAIRRRFNLIPFTVTIPPEERDEKLKDKLRKEWPGILSWMIEGCRAWRENGLQAPYAVTAATAEYLEGEDALTAWIDECCERDPAAWEPRNALFSSWRAWTERSGEYAGSQKRFSQTMEAHGFEPLRKHQGRGFLGLSIRRHDADDPWWEGR